MVCVFGQLIYSNLTYYKGYKVLNLAKFVSVAQDVYSGVAQGSVLYLLSSADYCLLLNPEKFVFGSKQCWSLLE